MQKHFQVDWKHLGVLLILRIIIEVKWIVHLNRCNQIFISSFCNLYMGKYRHYCSLTQGLY